MRQISGVLRSRLITVLVLGPLVLMWTVSSPMFSGPDEPDHLVRAQGFTSLDFSSPYDADGIPVGAVGCYRFKPDVPASCMTLDWREPREEDSRTDGYPPVLHALSAVPYFFTDGLTATYLVRLWLAMVNTAMVGWALTIAARRGSWVAIGALLTITPTALFTMGTVNPTGLAVSGSLLVSASMLDRRGTAKRFESKAALVTGAILVVGTRRDGAFWFALLLLVLWVALERSIHNDIRHIVRTSRKLMISALAVFALSSIWALQWVYRFLERRSSAERSAWKAASTLKLYFHQLIGSFGWLDSPIDWRTLLLAALLCGAVVIAGVRRGNPNQRRAIVLAIALMVIVPVAFGAIRYPYFQGRYLLLMWAGLMMIAGSSIEGRSEGRLQSTSLKDCVIGLWVIVHVWSLITNLKRFSTGRIGSWNIFSDDAWSPPRLGNEVVIAGFAIGGIAMFFAARAVVRDVLREEHSVAHSG
jgi:hypothetical protein